MAVTVPDSQANFLWIRAHEVPGKDLAGAPRGLPRPGRGRRAARRRGLRARRDSRPACRGPAAVGAARGPPGPGAGSDPRDEGIRSGGRGARAGGAGRLRGRREPSGPQKLDLEIGNLLPLTGYFDPFGKPTERASDVAAEEIRKAAAKAGARHTVQIHNVDYKSEPQAGDRSRQQARQERVDLPDRPVRLGTRRARRAPRSPRRTGQLCRSRPRPAPCRSPTSRTGAT